MKRILNRLLLATDFSECAGRAAGRAGLLATASGARVSWLHVVNRYSLDVLLGLLSGSAAEAEDELVAQARRELEAQVEAQRGRGITAQGEVVVGGVLASVLAAAERASADLVVMGATGAGRFRELVLGTTTERLVRKTAGNVLAVRRPPGGPYRSVLAPVDFSADSAAALSLARAVAPEAVVTVLHAYEVPFEGKLRHAGVSDRDIETHRADARERALGEMSAFLEPLGLPDASTRVEVVHGPAPRRILELAEALGSELIAVGKHGRSQVEDLLVGSVTLYILGYAEADVLIASAPREPAGPGPGGPTP
jgi:nucleotide-binding universal stress UspA family protein